MKLRMRKRRLSEADPKEPRGDEIDQLWTLHSHLKHDAPKTKKDVEDKLKEVGILTDDVRTYTSLMFRIAVGKLDPAEIVEFFKKEFPVLYREFLARREPGDVLSSTKVESEDKLALYIRESAFGGVYMVLYKATEADISVIAMVESGETSERCIPKTYEIERVATDPDMQKRGYGKLINRLLFGYLKKKGIGLTSDHSHGTLPGAAKMWVKIGKSKDFFKRKTDAGNKDFDYPPFDTPDPDDDCTRPSASEPATDSSWAISAGKASAVWRDLRALTQNHERIVKKIEAGEFPGKRPQQQTSFERRLRSKAGALFNRAYDIADVGEVREEKKKKPSEASMKKMHKSLEKTAKKKFPKDKERRDAYIYGAKRKTGWKPKGEK